MHLLGTSVLSLILLPLAFSCDYNSTRTIGDYNNIISIDLKHAEASIEQLNPNCTSRNAIMSPVSKPTNAQQIIRRKICRVNSKLQKFGMESENQNGQVKDVLNNLVKGINESLRCECLQKRELNKQREQKEQRDVRTQQKRKSKLCKVKDNFSILQTLFERHNAYQSSITERSEHGTISEKTGV